MVSKLIGSGQWETNSGGILMTTVFPTSELLQQQQQNMWNIGQIVDVRPRTWAGINRPGGTGRITNIHYATKDDLYSTPGVIGLDVKYTIYSGQDLNLDPELVKPHVELESRGRRREPAVKPKRDAENCRPNSMNRESIVSSKPVSKKQFQIGVKKGSASKAKLTLSRKVSFPGRRKSKYTSKKLAVNTSPSCDDEDAAHVSNIPREIVFNSAKVLNTPNSGCSKSATNGSLGCSPLGEEGVEYQLVATASYERLVQPLRPSVGTSNAHCPSNVLSDNENMNCDIIELRISPTGISESNKAMPESFISATPLATGRFSNEGHCSIGDDVLVDKSLKHNNSMVDLNVNKVGTAPLAQSSLRHVYDNELKKASKFIGDVIQGYSKIEDKVNNEVVAVHDNRLNRFRSLLNEYLSDSDGMIEVENLAINLSKFAESSADETVDYTETDVELYVSELCSQNKIMRTEGWIYNI